MLLLLVVTLPDVVVMATVMAMVVDGLRP